MVTDAWLIGALAHQIDGRFRLARIDRIGQPEPTALTLELRAPSDGACLVLSAHPELGRVEVLDKRPPNPLTPPPFCQLLRRHLEGSRLTACHQPGTERLLDFSFAGRDELGNPRGLRLIAEFAGRMANLILVAADGRIIDALRRVQPEDEGRRVIAPGVPYTPPPLPPGRIDLFAIHASGGRQALAAALLALLPPGATGQEAKAAVSRGAFGLSRPLLDAALSWAEGAPGCPGRHQTPPPDLPAAIADIIEAMASGMARPCVLHSPGELPVPSAWPLPGSRAEPAPGALEAVAVAYRARDSAFRMRSAHQRIGAVLRRALSHTDDRLAKQEQEMAEAREADRWREAGELLLAHLHEVPRGVAEVQLPGFDDPEHLITVRLQPARSPSANAQVLLQRYRKGKRAQGEIATRLEQGRSERSFLEEAELALEQAESTEELEALEAMLHGQGYAERRPQRARTPRRTQVAVAPPLRFAAGPDWIVLVGRNAEGNDRLTLDLGRPADIWLHARQMPGSHVLLRSAAGTQATPPDQALLLAAAAAAYFSAGRGLSAVPVDWTPRKNVRKPPGARPGFVTYQGEHTLLVPPKRPPSE